MLKTQWVDGSGFHRHHCCTDSVLLNCSGAYILQSASWNHVINYCKFLQHGQHVKLPSEPIAGVEPDIIHRKGRPSVYSTSCMGVYRIQSIWMYLVQYCIYVSQYAYTYCCRSLGWDRTSDIEINSFAFCLWTTREYAAVLCVAAPHCYVITVHTFLQNLLTRMQKYVVNAVSVSTDHQTYSNIVFKRYGQLLPPCTELNTSDHNIEKSFSSPHKRRSYLELSALIVTVRKREYEYAYSYHSTIIVKL